MSCIVERVTYQNEENSYAIIKVKAHGYNDFVAAVGNLAAVNVGAVLNLHGFWKIDSKYGSQFVVQGWSEKLPATVYGITKYLGSGLIKGIEPKYAKKIVDTFKEETLDVIENKPDELISVDGIGSKRVSMIKKAWQDQKEIKNIMIFLQDKDVSTTHAIKIYKTNGNDSLKVITENTYKLADDIWGIGFKTADSIAVKLGIDKESFVRCRSGILFTLNELSNECHCFAYSQQLVTTAVQLLEIDEQKIVMTISHMLIEKDIIDENKKMIYLSAFYYSEVGIAKRILTLLNAPRRKK